MFNGATDFNGNITRGTFSGWLPSSCTTMSGMLDGAASFDKNIGGWDVSNVANMSDMFTGASSFSTTNYDLLLEGWSTQTLQNAVDLGVGTTQYSSGAPATARGVLTSAPNNWVITDGGQVPDILITQGGDTLITQGGDTLIIN
jgi:hypothetical protein